MMSPQKQAVQVILILVLGMGAGLFAVLGLLHTYGPTGQYKAENVFLTPATLKQLGGEEIVFVTFNAKAGKWESRPLSFDAYEELFSTLARDKSEMPPNSEPFDAPLAGRLLILFKGEPVLEVQFAADGNHYRVRLRVQEKDQDFAYFLHPHILEKIK